MKTAVFWQTALIAVMLALLIVVPPPSPPARLAFMGDILLGRGIAAAHCPAGNNVDSGRSGEACEWESALSASAPVLKSADFALANLESPVTQAALINPAGYDLRARTPSLEALTLGGVRLLSITNNHSLDSGPQGWVDTRAAVLAAGLTPLSPPDQPVWRTIHGLRLAFFAFEDVTSPLDTVRATEGIRQAYQQGGIVIVSIHWGSEYNPYPSARQRYLAHSLAEAGAALIWGHHPHVLQPVEWLKAQNRSQPTLVAFSLGNALFDQVIPLAARRSAVLTVELSPQGVIDYQALPILIDPFHGKQLPADDETIRLVMSELGMKK